MKYRVLTVSAHTSVELAGESRLDSTNIRRKLTRSLIVKATSLVNIEYRLFSEQSKSAIPDHAVQHNHVINWKDAKSCKKNVTREPATLT